MLKLGLGYSSNFQVKNKGKIGSLGQEKEHFGIFMS